MLKRIRAFLSREEPPVFDEIDLYSLLENILDRLEELEMNVSDIEQRIDNLEDSGYNLGNYTLGK